MKAHIVLAEAATTHPDGTISMLRAGINQIRGEGPPFKLRAALAVRIQAELGDAGKHRFDLKCMNEDGAEALPTLEGEFEVAQGGGVSSFVLAMQVDFQAAGRFLFVLRVDRVQLDEWTITVG